MKLKLCFSVNTHVVGSGSFVAGRSMTLCKQGRSDHRRSHSGVVSSSKTFFRYPPFLFRIVLCRGYDLTFCLARTYPLRVLLSPTISFTAGKTSNDFTYLTTHAPAEDMDFTGLAEVQDAIRELGIENAEERDVFKALAGLLHLGQVICAGGN